MDMTFAVATLIATIGSIGFIMALDWIEKHEDRKK